MGGSLGGVVMYDVSAPVIDANYLPVDGVYAADGYTHDAHCVVYDGPDTQFVGREICFAYNEDSLTIIDVSIKSAPVQLSRTEYDTSRYTHQGWTTPDMKYILLDDELDEFAGSVSNTRTYIFDIQSLEHPFLGGFYDGPTSSIDHNLYIVGNVAYESNYRAGLRLLDTSSIDKFELEEIGYFDVYPEDDANQFGHGIWSTYPFWMEDEDPSRHFVVGQTKAQGFFVFKPHIPA